jgi:acetoin utilization deacetylase AcuC-like enzyme
MIDESNFNPKLHSGIGRASTRDKSTSGENSTLEKVGFKIVYSPKYEVDIGVHVFPTSKFRLIREHLLKNNGLTIDDFIEPSPATEEDLCLVHTLDYVTKIKNGTLTPQEELMLELPYSKALAEASFICVNGTIIASEIALRCGLGIHLGGGFHHAFSDHGEGFCVFNDVAVAAKKLLQKDRKVLIIDCDLHQGNGTAAIFAKEKKVFTFSIHQLNNYPFIKPRNDLDINLEDGVGDKEYLKCLNNTLPNIFNTFKPDFVFYLAGSDPYEKDQLGGLKLTIEGFKKRDELIFNLCLNHRKPACVVLAGGYALNLEDTITIHCNSCMAGMRICLGK